MGKDGPIYNKFKVMRNDGTDCLGNKHDGCSYFVLDVTHDPYALAALTAYATACRATHPELADDLKRLVREREADGSGVEAGR